MFSPACSIILESQFPRCHHHASSFVVLPSVSEYFSLQSTLYIHIRIRITIGFTQVAIYDWDVFVKSLPPLVTEELDQLLVLFSSSSFIFHPPQMNQASPSHPSRAVLICIGRASCRSINLVFLPMGPTLISIYGLGYYYQLESRSHLYLLMHPTPGPIS